MEMKTATPLKNPGWEFKGAFIEVVHHCQQSQPCSWEFHFDFLQLQSCKQCPFRKAPFQKQHAFHPTYPNNIYINGIGNNANWVTATGDNQNTIESRSDILRHAAHYTTCIMVTGNTCLSQIDECHKNIAESKLSYARTMIY